MSALKPAPITSNYLNEDRNGVDRKRLEAYLCSIIKHQKESINQITLALIQIINPNSRTTPFANGRITILSLCGVSGTGKTETVKQAKYLLGMDEGYENAGYYVEIRGGECNDEYASENLKGAASGLTGHDEKNTLADQLLAIKALINPAMKPETNKKGKNQKTLPISAIKERPTPNSKFCKCILLFIDEAHMAHPKYFQTLNSLFSDGKFENSHHDTFELPQDMKMLVLIASNFGAAQISEHCLTSPLREWSLCQEMIKRSIKEKGYGDETLARFGTLLVYYPLSEDDMRQIIFERLDSMMAGNSIKCNYPNIKLTFHEEDRENFIRTVFGKKDSGVGVRGAFLKMAHGLENLLTIVMSDHAEELKNTNHLIIFYMFIPYSSFSRHESSVCMFPHFPSDFYSST